MALVIIALAVSGLMAAIITSITTSGEHRTLSIEDTLLRSYAETYEYQLQSQPSPIFQPCATLSQYTSAFVPPATPSGYSVTPGIQFWNGSTFSRTCGSSADDDVQLITLTATGPGATQTLSFVVRNPNDDPTG